MRKGYIRGLIVREPYASMLARGDKVWEIRRYNTRVRGVVAFLYRGHLYGFGELVGVVKVSLEELEKYGEKHKAPVELLNKYARGRKSLYAWIFKNPIPLPKPVKISYPRGSQVWTYISIEKVVKVLSSEGYIEQVSKLLEKLG